MNILITGNLGYVGPVVVQQLQSAHLDANIIGFDMGYFKACSLPFANAGGTNADVQVIGDVRSFPEKLLEGVDAVVHLAAISNDPMGRRFEQVTMDINYRASAALAEKAKKQGVKSFVFASSCSIYGFAEDAAKTEDSSVNPLTTYAKSKVMTEQAIKDLASGDFKVTCLRFATACGLSERLRLDLVLNEFIASAVCSGEISILSDGTPWRPLIHIKDMARAIDWAISRPVSCGGPFLTVNTGSDEWNYQVIDLALAVSKAIQQTKIRLNKNAPSDKRSYKVNFGLYKRLAPDYQPQYDLTRTIAELMTGLGSIGFQDRNVRNSPYIRLKVLEELIHQKKLTDDLVWT